MPHLTRHTGRGIAWAPACGKSMAELILNGKSTSVDLTPFDPARFTPASSQRGGRGRKKQGESIGEQW
jgi:glycine/D-amino acid oxidase-like deaminating enzyme